VSAVWRCRVCEGVNRGGRVCATCGAEVPRGEPLRAAVRTVKPSTTPPAPAPVPPSVSRRELRDIPAPEEIWPVYSEEPLTFDNGFDIRPLPGGCLVSLGPRRPRSY
jgi:hypothetical protein